MRELGMLACHHNITAGMQLSPIASFVVVVIVMSHNNIDYLWDSWKMQFFKDLGEFIPKTTRKVKYSKNKSQPWFTGQLRRQIISRNRFDRHALRTRLPEDWRKYCLLRNKTNMTLRRQNTRITTIKASKVLSEPSCSSTTWWCTVQELSREL